MTPSAKLRSRESFDFDWQFKLDNARTWRSVQLPHDWGIKGPFKKDASGGGSHGFAPGGLGWYRKHFELVPPDRDRAIWIEFDGVYHNSDVWINDQHLGHRAYGYSSFHYDLAPHLRFDRANVIAVRVDNSDLPNCRWYSGSGIYRHVWLTKTSKLGRVAHSGTSVLTPRVTRASASVRVRTFVESNERYEVETSILDSRSRKVALGASSTIRRPRLWSIDDPQLYYAHTVVRIAGRAVDDYITPFGIRTATFDSRRGFLLNGRPVKMKGVCLHHDAGCVGAAVPDRVLERRLQILKEIGCNAIRCSHNPPAPELLDFADRMGFLVIDEAFDKWAGEFSKPNEWWMRQKNFNENWRQDLRAMLRRDRNHPSIVLWSVGNETGQPGTSQVNPTLKKLVEFVRREEPTRPVTAALVNSGAKTRAQRVRRVISSAKLMDVLSVNYQEPMFPNYRAADPNVIICGSETFKYFRGGEMNIHSFEPINPWYDVAKHDYVVGQFLWPGIDYLGESNQWPLRGWPTGIIDSCGFLKPEGWFHRSVWRDKPVVRIAVLADSDERASSWSAPAMSEHWNWHIRRGQLVEVRTQTNCESVELMLSGKSFGVRFTREYPNGAITWPVPFEAGILRAIARNRGRTVATHALETSGEPARIELEVDRPQIAADGQDVAHITAWLVDSKRRAVRCEQRPIRFFVEGSARLLATDHGDLRDRRVYASSLRDTRQGRCMAIVQAVHSPGISRIRATSDGLQPASAVIRTSPKQLR